MKLKLYHLLLLGSLFWSACSNDSIDEIDAVSKHQIVSEFQIEGEPPIRDTLIGCEVLLRKIIRGGSRSSFDTLPGYTENERGHSIKGMGFDNRAGIFIHRPKHQDALFSRVEIQSLVEGFEQPSFTGEYVYPILSVAIGEKLYRSFLYDLRSHPHYDFHVSKYDPQALVALDFHDLGTLALCNNTLPSVGQVDVKYQGYLYTYDGIDSLHIDANYSVIISDQW